MEQNCMAAQIVGKGITSWTDDNGNSDFDTEIRPCKIMAFIGHTFTVSGEKKKHVIAKVKWYAPYNEESNYKSPITVWESNKFIRQGPSMYMPVQRFHSKFANAKSNAGRLIVSPLLPNVYM